MRTLVTGGSGFVGSAVVRRLLEAGHEIRALVRPKSRTDNLAGLPVEIVSGDILDPASLAAAVAGCDAVFHVAADYRLWVPKPAEIYESNVTGTRNVMRAAAAARARRIVYTSSVATLGLTADGTPADEDTPSGLDDMIGHYKRSKFLAEAEVRELVDTEGLPAVIVNPSAPVGPRDIRPTPTGRLIVDAASGRMPAFVDTGLNIVHVDDVAEGHMLAFEKGRIGRRYILGGTNMTLREILEEIALATGRTPPRIRLPHAVVLPVAFVAERLARLLPGFEPVATVESVRMSMKRMYFSSERARRELGYAPRPAREALIDALAWFRSHGYLG
jgi:dihydroflavonol-4-reductase